jgi:hypothetical protein
MEHQWNEIDRRKPTARRKTCSSATLSTTNPTWTDPGSNPILRSERPATNRLSHGTAFSVMLRRVDLCLSPYHFATITNYPFLNPNSCTRCSSISPCITRYYPRNECLIFTSILFFPQLHLPFCCFLPCTFLSLVYCQSQLNAI